MNRHHEGVDPTQLGSSTGPDLSVLAETRRSLTLENAPLWRVLAAATCGTLARSDPPRQGFPMMGNRLPLTEGVRR